MPINLNRVEQPAITKLQGVDTFIVTAGKRVTIETSPQGVEVLSATVPEGKEWAVSVGINIVETDS